MLDEYTHKVVLVGDGAVGSAFAFSLLQSTHEIDELVIVDRNQQRLPATLLTWPTSPR